MTLLNQLEDMITEGQVSQVHFGKSVLENLTGAKRFCTITKKGEPSHGNTVTGQGDTCEGAISDALGKMSGAVTFEATVKVAPPPAAEVVEDLDDLLG